MVTMKSFLSTIGESLLFYLFFGNKFVTINCGTSLLFVSYDFGGGEVVKCEGKVFDSNSDESALSSRQIITYKRNGVASAVCWMK